MLLLLFLFCVAAVHSLLPSALSLLGADNLHTAAVHKENVLGLLVEAVARPDWPARDTTLHALAQLASIDAASQYAVITAGVVPVLVRVCFCV